MLQDALGSKCQQWEDTYGCGHQRQADTLGAYQCSPGLQAGWHLHLEKLTIVQYMKPGAGYSMAPRAGPRCEAVLRRGKGAKKAVQVTMGQRCSTGSLGREIPGNFPFPGKRAGNSRGSGIPVSREFPVKNARAADRNVHSCQLRVILSCVAVVQWQLRAFETT